jgi:hypothetical protein
MRTISILEDDDVIDPDDWCRPLQIVSMNGGHSDGYSFKSCYSGTPENNTKWVKVKHVIGSCWFGKKVKTINKGLKYEFVSGDIPKSHRLDMKGYNSLHDMSKKQRDEEYDDDIPF